MPLFGKSQKNPAELVRALRESVVSLEAGDRKAEKAQEDVSKNLNLMKTMLYGSPEQEPQTDMVISQLAQVRDSYNGKVQEILYLNYLVIYCLYILVYPCLHRFVLKD